MEKIYLIHFRGDTLRVAFYIFLAILFLIFLLFLIPLKVNIILKIQKSELEDQISLYIRTLFGFVQYRLVMPFSDIFYQELEALFCIKTDESKTNSNQNTHYKEQNKFYSFKDSNKKKYIKYYKILSPVIFSFLNKLKFHCLHWTTDIGIKDAAVTGMLSGFLWIIKGHLISFLNNNVVCRNMSLAINPFFNKDIIRMHLDCIIGIKIGYIITASIKTAFLIITKGGEANEQSSHRSFDEDNHGKSEGYGRC